MSATQPRRFYSDAAVEPAKNGFAVTLDGKPLRTAEQNRLALPSLSLAEALAKEWRAAEEHIVPQAMPLTKLAFTAVDRVSPQREAVIEQISAYANSDVVCYRASAPDDLVKRQGENWDAIIEWAELEFDIEIRTGEGITPIAQEYETLCALTSAFSEQSNFYLAALYSLVENSKSLILALAVAIGGRDPDEAFRSANCDELYQSDKWGRDVEAQARLEERAVEFRAAAAFIRHLQ